MLVCKIFLPPEKESVTTFIFLFLALSSLRLAFPVPPFEVRDKRSLVRVPTVYLVFPIALPFYLLLHVRFRLVEPFMC